MELRDIAFNNLEKYIDLGFRRAWIGVAPLIDAESMPLNIATNFRAHRKHHQYYDSVWIIENNIFEKYEKSWLLIIDEAIRLIKDEGTLIVRTVDCHAGTLFSLKSHLYRNNNLSVTLLEQIKTSESSISIFNIKRRNILSYSDECWSFGILSNGVKNGNVINLVTKINEKASEAGKIVEIIIAGPEIDSLVEINNLRYININNSDNLPRISEKKNAIVSEAKYANIAIFHDRYQIDDNFFIGFDYFGYDFDFLTVRQVYPSGKEFPSYLMFPVNEKRWQQPIRIDSYDQVYPSSFLNGGLIIIKKHNGKCINFNPLLLHNEAEDVEISMQMFSNGLVPRINAFSLAHTIGIDESYTATFIRTLPTDKGRCFKRILLKCWCVCPNKIKDIARHLKLYEKIKSYYNN
uniref:Uncharacterized protein n=1 Tax=Aeromonas hydrophila TaxID=644 RepID=A0A346ACA3_AERHY|nr:hypothetical protein [Aeromonas hydrophila]